MASTSSQQFHSNGNYRRWLDETFDGPETTEDELSDNLDGNDNIVQPSVQNFPIALEPFIGMEFDSAGMPGNSTRWKCTKRENGVFSSRPATREGCNAMLRIAAKDGGKWVIYGFVKEHSHELNPSKIPPRRSHRIAFNEDGKDLKIRELSTELHREKKKSAAYQEQLQIVLKYIEEHTQRLSLKIEAVSNNVREIECEEPDNSDSN
ncbi:hypothetical protein GH714_010784 [Hevea brasiliensis]|uniref:FAR1 domain-containing protein n=1 Tax=Hevea brasiliensis TaxID=3981 RepID=A0A6A6LIX5_HEVBR|nr:hypothetical protein GH714_010784 [Hevea brasiliensis]